MFRMMQDMRGAPPLRMTVFKGVVRTGTAMALISCIAGTASAQVSDQVDQLTSNPVAIAPPSDAPPRSIIQRYKPDAPRPRGEMSLLVDAPPLPGAPSQPVSSSATGGDVIIGDRVDGPAINTLAAGRSAIAVSVGAAHRQ